MYLLLIPLLSPLINRLAEILFVLKKIDFPFFAVSAQLVHTIYVYGFINDFFCLWDIISSGMVLNNSFAIEKLGKFLRLFIVKSATKNHLGFVVPFLRIRK